MTTGLIGCEGSGNTSGAGSNPTPSGNNASDGTSNQKKFEQISTKQAPNFENLKTIIHDDSVISNDDSITVAMQTDLMKKRIAFLTG